MVILSSKSRDQGLATWTFPDGRVIEKATYTCCHCNSIVTVVAKADASTLGGWCGMCTKPTCSRPGCNDGCAPFERQMESAERRERMFRAVGI
jgi:hypothetical protein